MTTPIFQEQINKLPIDFLKFDFSDNDFFENQELELDNAVLRFNIYFNGGFVVENETRINPANTTKKGAIQITDIVLVNGDCSETEVVKEQVNHLETIINEQN